MKKDTYTLDEIMNIFIKVGIKLPMNWYNKYYEDTGEFSLDSKEVFEYGFKNRYWEESISERIKRLGLDPYEMIDILENEGLIESNIWPILEEYEKERLYENERECY